MTRRNQPGAPLAVILIVAWLLGFGVFNIAGGLTHVLLIGAVISILWHFVGGGRRLRM